MCHITRCPKVGQAGDQLDGNTRRFPFAAEPDDLFLTPRDGDYTSAWIRKRYAVRRDLAELLDNRHRYLTPSASLASRIKAVSVSSHSGFTAQKVVRANSILPTHAEESTQAAGRLKVPTNRHLRVAPVSPSPR